MPGWPYRRRSGRSSANLSIREGDSRRQREPLWAVGSPDRENVNIRGEKERDEFKVTRVTRVDSSLWVFKRVLESKATESIPKRSPRPNFWSQSSKGDHEVILYFKSLIVRVSAEAIFYICFGDSSGKVSRAFPSPGLCKMTPKMKCFQVLN